ncbi:hypothetical protein APSETT445_009139 [Aspergillus pseudonomiae]
MVVDADAVARLDSSQEAGDRTVSQYQAISKDSDRQPNGYGDDEESALLSPPTANDERAVKLSTSVSTIVAVLLLGEFISNADSTLVMAATAKVSSEFNKLQDASWLSTGYTLGIPFIVLGGLLVIAKLNITYHATSKASIRRVDFLGAGLLGASVVAIIMLLDRGGHAFPWISLPSFLLGGVGIASLMLFVWAERVAAEPIFDLRILARPNVASSYMVGFLQITSQLGMLFSVPLYFQVTQRASATVAGGHLVPAVVGNTVGGLVAGNVIRRTGRYKTLLVIGGLIAAITHVLMLIRWNGHTNIGESLYIIPGGIGTGIASASAFVAMTALLEPQDMAMATGGYMLIVSFAMTTGITMTNTVLGLGFKHQLEQNLHGSGAKKIIRRATSDTNYIAKLEGKIWEVVVGCFVAGLKNTYAIYSGCPAPNLSNIIRVNMILSGLEVVTRQLVRNLRHLPQQQQPCGVDLTLRQVCEWTSAACIDFDNTKRQAAKTSNLPFDNTSHAITLQPGAYLVDFNETVQIPRNCMGSVFPRSSLWRSGVGIVAGVVDAGYEGAMGALLEVKSPHGVVLYRNAKLAQIVFHELGETVEGYNGIYQSSTSSVGRDGTERT